MQRLTWGATLGFVEVVCASGASRLRGFGEAYSAVSLLVAGILALACVQGHCADRVCDIVRREMHERLQQTQNSNERAEAWRAIYHDLNEALAEEGRSSCYDLGLIEKALSALKGGLYEEAAEAYDMVFTSGADRALVNSGKTIEKNAAVAYLAVGRLEDATRNWAIVWAHAVAREKPWRYEELGHYLSSALEWLTVGQERGRPPWVCLRPVTDVQTAGSIWRDADNCTIRVRFTNLQIALAAVHSMLSLDEPILLPGFITSREELQGALDLRDSWHPELRREIEEITAIDWPTGESFELFSDDALVRVPHMHILVTAESAEEYCQRASELARNLLKQTDLPLRAFVQGIRLVRQLTQIGLLPLGETIALADSVAAANAARYSQGMEDLHNLRREIEDLRMALNDDVRRLRHTIDSLGAQQGR